MRTGLMSGLMLATFLASLAAIAGDAPVQMRADLLPVDGRDARLGLRGTATVVMDESGPDLRVHAAGPLGLSGELLRVDACEGTVGWIRLQPGANGLAEGELRLRGFAAAPDCHAGDAVALMGASASAEGQLQPGV